MAMRHMKELWFYMGHRFTDHERYWKKLRKMRDTGEYALWVKQILREGIFDPEIGFKPPLK